MLDICWIRRYRTHTNIYWKWNFPRHGKSFHVKQGKKWQEIEKTPCRNVLIKWNDHIFAVCQSASLHSLLIPLPIYFLQFKISANSRGGNLPEQYLQDERKPFGTKCNLRMSKSLWMRCQRNGKRANITIVVFEFFFRENVIVSFSFNANDGVWDGYMYLAGAEKG